MKLEYSILWFDDNGVYFDSLNLEPLRSEILSWGFSPKIVPVSTPEEFLKHSPFDVFDLVVVDQHLEGYDDGQEFITKLRANTVYTEVIFYTAGEASALWDAIREKQLEGVFVSTRSEILSKINMIGRQSIRKVLDIENMRGIVMAEVGELDHLLDRIMTVGFGSLSEDQRRSVFHKFHESADQQNKSDGERLANFVANPQLDEMLNMCDSNKRWQNYRRLKKHHAKIKGRAEVGDYVEELLTPRNFLAHGKPQSNPAGGYLFEYNKKTLLFDEASSVGLRQTIMKYRSEFSDILTLLSQLADGPEPVK